MFTAGCVKIRFQLLPKTAPLHLGGSRSVASYGHIAAIDVEHKRIAWDIRTEFPMVSGISATASGLVITGTPDQFMLFLDARDGRELHRIKAPSGWHSSPVIYAVDGRQFIAFANGWGGWVSGFNLTGTPELRGLPGDNILFSFALPVQ